MKKLLVLLFCSICVLSLYGQTVPSDRVFFGAVHQWVTEHSGRIEKADVSVSGNSEEIYILREVAYKYKSWGSYYEELYTVTITKTNDGVFKISISENYRLADFNSDYSRQLSDWKDKDDSGNKSNLKEQMTKQLNALLFESDSMYEDYINSALTDPSFLYSVFKDKNSLWIKTFLKRNEIIGRTCRILVRVIELDESDDESWLYKLVGTVGTANRSTGEVEIPLVYYSNDDAMIDADVGKKVTITGTIEAIEFDESSGVFSAIKIVE